MMTTIFKSLNKEQVDRIIGNLGHKKHNDWLEIGFDHGGEYYRSGHKITHETPLWLDLHDINYIIGFKKGYHYEQVITILDGGIKENIPDCCGISIGYPIYDQDFDEENNKLRKVFFGFIFDDRTSIDLSIESINWEIRFGLVGTIDLNEVFNFPLVEIKNFLETKKGELNDLFVSVDDLGEVLEVF
jgi:hypothetical protein